MSGQLLAVDIGGTKVAAAVVDRCGALVGSEHRLPTPISTDPNEVLAVVAEVVGRARTGAEEACGIACAGLVEGGELVTTTNIPAWVRYPLRATIADLVGLPTVLENDGRALALAEGRYGAARGVATYMAVTVSTGVGSGIVVDGNLLRGAGNAGELGHIVVESDGTLCGCGGRGCLETVASGLAIQRRTGRPAAEASVEVRRDTARLLAAGISPVVTALDLQMVTLSGGVTRGFGPDFVADVATTLREWLPPFLCDRDLVRASGLGPDAGVLAAAAAAVEATP